MEPQSPLLRLDLQEQELAVAAAGEFSLTISELPLIIVVDALNFPS